MARYIASNIEKRYDLAVSALVGATITLDLAERNVFRAAITETTTIEFANTPSAERAMTVVIHLSGASLPSRVINWPAGIIWNRGAGPEFNGTKAVVILLWTGDEWMGSVGVDNA